MEITVKRRRRGWWRALRALAVAAVLLAVALMVPPAFGYHAHVVSDGSAAAAVARGSVLVDAPVPASGLEVGDVVAFPAPGADDDELVTRRVLAVGAGWFETRSDTTDARDVWQLGVDVGTDRAVASVPFVGYPALILGGAALPAWTPAALALGLALLLLLLRRSSRAPDDDPAGPVDVLMAPSGVPAPPTRG